MTSKPSFLRVVGMDPSLRNWGWAMADYWIDTGEIKVLEIGVIQPIISTGKQVRQNNKDLEAAQQLYRYAAGACAQSQATFVEVPVGSQNARSMASYGICAGVLGSMQATGHNFFEVTATEVKVAATGNKEASKAKMIEWARAKYPDINWPMYKENGVLLLSEAKAEHMADAIATIHAGIKLPSFQQLLQMRKAA